MIEVTIASPPKRADGTGATRAILLEAPDHPGYDELPDTLAERQALPARFHIPVLVDTCTPKAWVCAVCWDEGMCTAWPCQPATDHAGEVFEGGHNVRIIRPVPEG